MKPIYSSKRKKQITRYYYYHQLAFVKICIRTFQDPNKKKKKKKPKNVYKRIRYRFSNVTRCPCSLADQTSPGCVISIYVEKLFANSPWCLREPNLVAPVPRIIIRTHTHTHKRVAILKREYDLNNNNVSAYTTCALDYTLITRSAVYPFVRRMIIIRV